METSYLLLRNEVEPNIAVNLLFHSTLSLQQHNSEGRPLVLLLPWFQSKPKHVEKFSELYTAKGFDVLTCVVLPLQFPLPAKGSQLVADDLLKFLMANDCYKRIMIHGFSIGGYLWGECMVKMLKDVDKYQPLIDRFKMQIWDSIVDFNELTIGMSNSLPNPILRRLVRSYLEWHLKASYDVATKHYINSSTAFHDTIIPAPALFITSKTDPTGTEKTSQIISDKWKAKGIPTTFRCFDKSPHVAHFRYHRDEYLKLMLDHMKSVDLID